VNGGAEGSFLVDQDGFRGSLSELATALRRGRIEPGALDLLTLVNGFLAHFERQAERDLDAASEGLPAVAQVVELKLRLLLPRPPRTEDPMAEDLDDEVTAAVESLARLEEAIAFLRERRERRRHVLAARASPIDFPRRVAPTRVALARLAALAARYRANAYFELVRDRLSVPEAMRRLLERLGRLRRADFDGLTAPSDWATRTIYFVGLLELVRERRVSADQSAAFEPIVVERLEGAEERRPARE
jgi:segregation and condensation protein A